MDHGIRMTINLLPFYEDIDVMRSYTVLEITYFDVKIQSCNRAQICRYTMYRRHGSTEYDTEHYSEHTSEIPNYAATSPSFNAEYDLESILSHTGTMPIPHTSKLYEISRKWSNDL